MSNIFLSDRRIIAAAKRLDDITFDRFELTESRWLEATNKGQKWKHAYLMYGSRFWDVRTCVSGMRLLLGRTVDGAKAVRFADMAIVYFWPYRQTRNRPITDADMNLSLEQAQEDLATNIAATEILKDIESLVLATRLVRPVDREAAPARVEPEELLTEVKLFVTRSATLRKHLAGFGAIKGCGDAVIRHFIDSCEQAEIAARDVIRNLSENYARETYDVLKRRAAVEKYMEERAAAEERDRAMAGWKAQRAAQLKKQVEERLAKERAEVRVQDLAMAGSEENLNDINKMCSQEEVDKLVNLFSQQNPQQSL